MPDIYRIKIEDSEYDVKDKEVRNVLDILLGREESENNKNK